MAAPLRAQSNGTEAAALGHPRALGSLSQRARAAVCPGWRRLPRLAGGMGPTPTPCSGPDAAGGAGGVASRRRGRARPRRRLWLCGPLRLGVLGSCGEDEGLRALPGTRSVFGKWRLLLFMTLIAEEREPRRQNVLGPVRGPVDDPGLGGQTLGWGFTKAGTGDGQHAAGRGRRSRVCGGGTQGPQGPDEAAELRFKGIGRTPGRRQPREPGRQGPGSCEEAGRNAAPHLQSPESRE